MCVIRHDDTVACFGDFGCKEDWSLGLGPNIGRGCFPGETKRRNMIGHQTVIPAELGEPGAVKDICVGGVTQAWAQRTVASRTH